MSSTTGNSESVSAKSIGRLPDFDISKEINGLAKLYRDHATWLCIPIGAMLQPQCVFGSSNLVLIATKPIPETKLLLGV